LVTDKILRSPLGPVFGELRDSMQIRLTDVAVVSFPKSGRTWLRVMLAASLNKHYGCTEQQILDSRALRDLCPSVPRIVFTHDRANLRVGLEGNFRRFRSKDVIFLVRDPLDVVVSYYFQRTRRQLEKHPSIEEFARSPKFGIRRVVDFMNDWYAQAPVFRSFLLLRYEDLVACPVPELDRTLKFLGVEPTREVVEETIRTYTFERMRSLERQRRHRWLAPGDERDPESYKVRRGKIGGFADYLNEATCREMREIIDSELHPDLGYVFSV